MALFPASSGGGNTSKVGDWVIHDIGNGYKEAWLSNTVTLSPDAFSMSSVNFSLYSDYNTTGQGVSFPSDAKLSNIIYAKGTLQASNGLTTLETCPYLFGSESAPKFSTSVLAPNSSTSALSFYRKVYVVYKV